MAISTNLDSAIVSQAFVDAIYKYIDGAENVVISNLEMPKSSGLSAETVLFRAEWQLKGEKVERELVGRIQPQGEGLFMDYDLALEYKVIKALEPTSVPVPEALFVELDSEALGTPFMVMSRVEGRIAPDDPPFTTGGWVLELSEEEQAKLADNSLSSMAQLHAIDLKSVGLENIGHGDQSLSGVDRLIAYWSDFTAWASDAPNPVIEFALQWVKDNKPAELGEEVLSWGDARLGNMLIDDDLKVSAIIDWEMVSTGPRELDLAWWLFLLEHHSAGIGAPLPPGFPTEEQEIRRYEELSGHIVQNLHFCKVLSAIRMCSLVARAAQLMKLAELIPQDSPMALVNPATILLAKMLDLPQPTGESDYYIGNRD